MEEKRCLTDTLKALGRDEGFSEIDNGKGDLLRLWRGGEERWKMMWGRAIRFIFKAENHTDVEQILAS